MKLQILKKMNRIPSAEELQILLAVLMSGFTSKSQECMDIMSFLDGSEQIHDFDVVSNGKDVIIGVSSDKGRHYARFLVKDGELIDN